jgi:hypothetical protein
MTAALAGPFAYLQAVAFAAPGMPDWPAARVVLRGEQSYQYRDLEPHQTTLLPANERRRASEAVRMAFRIAEAGMTAAGGLHRTAATVFASADGDLGIACRICQALAEPPRMVSPTDFHNSVHNAPAGYWSIATANGGPSTAVAAGDGSFAAGLLEALCTSTTEHRRTLLVASDVPAPQPLQDKRPMRHPVGTALMLSPNAEVAGAARLTLELSSDPDTRMAQQPLEELRLDNPAARVLPLLALLASGESGVVSLPLDGGISLRVHVQAANGAQP